MNEEDEEQKREVGESVELNEEEEAIEESGKREIGRSKGIVQSEGWKTDEKTKRNWWDLRGLELVWVWG